MYEINGSAINASPINGVGVAAVTLEGSGALISIEQSVARVEVGGSLFTIEQTVARIGAGALITLNQSVRLRLTGAGSLFNIEQAVANIASGSLINIEQTVRPELITGRIALYGWDLALYIGGVEVPTDQIHGTVTVTRNENSSALLDVTLINRSGVQDLDQFHGKTITLDVDRASGRTRVYTGVIDIPEIDLINKLITLRCTDRRSEQINEQLGSQLPFIGSWSDAIFQDADDVAGELSQRLLTTTKTVDFDAYGNYTIANYLPKATADFTLSDSGIYRRSPTLQVASRGRLINRVNVEFEYRYTRLRHRERNFQLFGATFCDVINTPGLQFLAVDGVQSNLESFGWPVKKSSIGYTYLPEGGWYNCGYGKFLWSPIIQSGTTSIQRDDDGNAINDANGNPLTEVTNRTVTDYTQAFALDASWTAAKRFAQDVTEKINIQVNAPQSINQYGVIEQYQRNGFSFEYNSADFEREDLYVAPDDFIETAGDYYLDKTGTAAHYKKALGTAIGIADTKIQKSHRDNYINIETPTWPEIDLKHTVAITAGVIQGRGKVNQISHEFDISNRDASTTVRLAFSQSQGSQAPDSLTIPILNAPLVGGFDAGTLKMYTYLGGELGGVGFGQTGQRTEGIITPAIDDESRNRQEYETSYSFDTAIQDDNLVVTF